MTKQDEEGGCMNCIYCEREDDRSGYFCEKNKIEVSLHDSCKDFNDGAS